MLSFIKLFFSTSEILIYLGIFLAIIVGIVYVVNKFRPSALSVIGNFFSKPVFYVGLIICVIIAILYYIDMNEVKKIALMEYNREQLEQNIKDQQKLMETQQKITEDQKQITAQLVQQNEKLAAKIGSIDRYLSSDDAKKSNRASSDVLKNTIKLLSQGQQ
jgi:amino acid permease